MGSKMYHRCLPSLFLAVFVQFLCSCTSVGVQGVREVLVSADSLMNSSPEASLYTLNGIDSSSLLSLGRRDRAYYILLMTEAEYKCYLPVGEDTVIFRAADYYRRKGPEELYARALIMQGAVQSERGESEAAMESYKAAEPVAERVGNLEQLGLLNVRIGELYQNSAVNDGMAIERYAKAVKYFEKAGLSERELRTRISMARMLLIDSVDAAKQYLDSVLITLERYDDKDLKLSVYELLVQYYYYRQDYSGLLEVAKKVSGSRLNYTAESNACLNILDNIYTLEAIAYSRLGFNDSARNSMKNVVGTEDEIAKMRMYWVEEEIARNEKNWEQAYYCMEKADMLADSIAEAGYRANLLKKEQSIDKERLINENLSYELRQNKIIKYFLFSVTLLFLLLAVLYIRYRKLCAKYDKLSASIIKGDEINAKQKNPEIENILKDFIELSKGIHEIRYRYEKIGTAYMREVDSILKKYLPEQDTDDRVRKICNHLYPGVLDNVKRKYPSLTPNDLQLIALMACGFPTGAICAIKRIGENSLNVQKSRTAKKIGAGIRLKDFVAENFRDMSC